MSKTTVVNIGYPRYSSFGVYIGRDNRSRCLDESFLANPFKIYGKITREKSIEMYRDWFYKKINSDSNFREKVSLLKGKTLGCWCKPLACHGDVVVEWIEENVE